MNLDRLFGFLFYMDLEYDFLEKEGFSDELIAKIKALRETYNLICSKSSNQVVSEDSSLCQSPMEQIAIEELFINVYHNEHPKRQCHWCSS